MRRLTRLELSGRSLRTLSDRTDKVNKADDPKAEAKRLWNSKSNKTFDEIRQTLAAMCSGNDRCMYCEDSAGTDIEHFWPKSVYPEKAYTWTNYLWACSRCNSNYKRDEFPLDDNDTPLLIDPTAEDPLEHLTFSPRTGKVVAFTPKGEASDRVYGLSRGELKRGRAASWTSYEALIEKYARAKRKGDEEEARRVATSIESTPHSGIFILLVNAALDDETTLLVSDACVAAVRAYPEIRTWLR